MDTKILRTKILDLAIHGKLVPQDPNDEPASALLARIRAEKEQLVKDGKLKKKDLVTTPVSDEDKPFEVPEGWEWTNIGNVLINRDAERVPLSSAVRKKQANRIYDYYGATGIVDKVDGYLFDERLMLIGEDGANLLSRSKNNAFFAEGKYWVNNHAHILDCIDKTVLDYVAMVINSMSLEKYVTGSAQPKLNQDNLNKIPIPLPPLAEQQRIVAAVEQWMSLVDIIESGQENLHQSIALAKNKILDLAIKGKLVEKEEEWEEKTLEDVLEYEQPQKYIVETTDYADFYETPVLTAGKSFIIGYTNEKNNVFSDVPVIIFDDFTTDCKYVDFSFKVKSSAMKILHLKGNHDLKYIYYFMSTTKLIGETHKRYWISEYSKLPIPLPPLSEQHRIVAKIEELFAQLDIIAKALK